MPDLVGLYWQDAEPLLRNGSWRGNLVKAPNVPVAPEQRNRVVWQDPPAGTTISVDTYITVAFGS